MGMSIDEIIQYTQIIKAQAEWDYPLDWQIVFDGAIETMRKYQKIEQIIKDHDADRMPEDYWYLDKIREVVENGKID